MAYLTIEEAAKELRMQPSTVRRKIKDGLIPVCRLGGSTSPPRIDRDELKRIMRGARSVANDMQMFAEHHKNPSEEVQYAELNRRCMKLAEAVGPKPIHELLKSFGAESLALLHPDNYSKFRGKLMRLAINPGWVSPFKKRKAA